MIVRSSGFRILARQSFRYAINASIALIVFMTGAVAQPVCSIQGPDSLFFDKIQYNAYAPPIFSIQVLVTNPGSAQVDSAAAFARSNPRFTIIGQASLLVADTLHPGDSAFISFLLSVNPRAVSGFDTLVVAISGNAGMRSECQLVLWVEKEYHPQNEIVCPPDSLLRIVFVDTLNEYRPNPILVPVTVINWGDAPSKETRIVYVATPGLATADGQDPIHELGIVAQNGGRATRIYRLQPVPRPDDTTVTVRFKAQGKGGPGDRIIDTICETRVRIPATRAPVFSVDCENGIHIEYNNGAYSPNPFLWRLSIRNTGSAKAPDVRASLSLPPHFELDSFETEEHLIGDMGVGEVRSTTWRIRAELLPYPDTGVLCVRVYDRFNRSANCCDTVILPSTRIPELQASCLVIPDSVHTDPATGEYRPNEISASVSVSNSGTEHVDSVTAEIIISDPDIALHTPTERTVLLRSRLDPNGFAQARWTIRPILRPYERDIAILFRITGSGIQDVTTMCRVHIDAALQPLLSCSASTDPPDTLHFNRTTLEYDTVTVSAEVVNTGSIAAPNVQATILLPPRIGFVAGEEAIKTLGSGPLIVNARWKVSWRILPVKRREGRLDTIRVEFRSGDKNSVCEDWLFIIGIPPVTVLSIPVNNVNNYNHALRIPIHIDNTDNKGINDLHVAVQYDTTKVDFTGFEPIDGLLTSWLFTSQSIPGAIRFSARSDSLVLHGEGVLLHMTFRVRYGLGEDILRISGTELGFDTTVSSVNRGTILARYLNGYIYVSGDCLPPLVASERFVLVTSNPNPTAATSNLTVTVPYAGRLSMHVLDVLGRTVHKVTERPVTQGSNTITFDGTLLPKGTYRCLVLLDGLPVGSASVLLR